MKTSAAILLTSAVLAGCTPADRLPMDERGPLLMPRIVTYGPDEHGVICYVYEERSISCLQVAGKGDR